MQKLPQSVSKWKLTTLILIVALVFVSFIALVKIQGGVSSTPNFLNVSVSPDSASIGVNKPTTFTASVSNAHSNNLEYTWSVSPSDNKTVLLPMIKACNLTFTEATTDRYVISVQVKDLTIGNLGSGSATVYDPYTSPTQYLGSVGLPYSYLIQTDGLGWYRAIKGTDNSVLSSSTTCGTVTQATADAMQAKGGIIHFSTGVFVDPLFTLSSTSTSSNGNIRVEGSSGTPIGQPMPVADGFENYNGTVFRLSKNNDFVTITGSSNNLHIDGVTFSHITFDGAGYTGRVVVKWASYCTFSDCAWINCNAPVGDGVISLYSSWNIKFPDCATSVINMANTAGTAYTVYMFNGNNANERCSEIWFDKCHFGGQDNSLYQIYVADIGSSTSDTDQVWITNSHFESFDSIVTDSAFIAYVGKGNGDNDALWIDKNVFGGNAYYDIYLSKVFNVHITNNAMGSTTAEAIKFDSTNNVYFFDISGNNIASPIGVPAQQIDLGNGWDGSVTQNTFGTDTILQVWNWGANVTLSNNALCPNMPSSPSTTGLVAFYPMNELTANGTTLYDHSSYNNAGVISNTTWTQAQSGPALQFDGVTSYVNVPNSASLRVTKITIIVTVTQLSLTGAREQIISKAYAGDSGYQLMLDSDGKLRWSLYIGGADYDEVWSASALTLNSANRIAITYDGSTIKGYINGTQATHTRSISGVMGANNQPLRIGCIWAGAYQLDAKLNNLYIYNRGLSPIEIYNDAKYYGF